MRNGKHYVHVRMIKSEKDKFLRLSTLCRSPEKTVLYWLVNDMIVNEKPMSITFGLVTIICPKQPSTNITGFQRSLMTAIAKSLSKDYSQTHITVKTVSNNIERQ